MKTHADLIDRLRAGPEPLLLLICGMPGTRKSSTAVQVGAALGFSSVVGMDEVRDVMLLNDRRPILQGKSHDRWQLFGELNEENFRRGFLGHCEALRDGALAIVRKNLKIGENTVVEGVHLVPSLYAGIAGAKVVHVVLVGGDLAGHPRLLDQKFGRRHGRQEPWTDEKVRHLEQIQDLLTRDAAACGAPVIRSTDPEDNCARIIEIVRRSL